MNAMPTAPQYLVEAGLPARDRDTVLGLTPAARATSLSVMRPVARWLLEAVLTETDALDKG